MRLHSKLAAAVAAGCAIALTPIASAFGDAAGQGPQPSTPIHHFLVLLQENHTFDNYFGTYPGADGIPRHTCVPVNPAVGKTPCIRPFHLGNRPIADLDHSESSAKRDLNSGRMDGFVRAQSVRVGNGAQAMGYYNASDVPFYWNMADRYELFDHLFSSSLSGSFLNHVYWIGAAAGNATQAVPLKGLKLTTIFDRLQQAGVSWKFYVQNYDPKITYRSIPYLRSANRVSQAVWCPLLDIPRFLDRPDLRAHIVDLTEYYSDLRDGTLPAVAYLVPSGASEHPPGSIATGQRFVRGLMNSLMSSRAWDSSAFMLAYDDWGGWYDHVLPPRRDAHGDGFRVPALLVSPYARRHVIDHTKLDFTSILKFIEQNWRLRPLTRLDAKAGSIMGAFDFQGPPRRPAIIPLQRSNLKLPVRHVRDIALYGLYGAGVLFALCLILLAWLRPARRKHRRLIVFRSEGRSG